MFLAEEVKSLRPHNSHCIGESKADKAGTQRVTHKFGGGKGRNPEKTDFSKFESMYYTYVKVLVNDKCSLTSVRAISTSLI